ncbi:YihY/virulence factor BrkB family protein [Cellulomonas edaphi]|uniref:YihY/virulence factor BrkB family protein n=1 Tax=Cellulomonas edaphi TaxID=3053468 RepID=A0ABT7S5C3_9CELL|nr:YihY/virulence factor BrkB family protein [Cellulomons edaphi]MDM7830823.1 YihY/virulence factor BrkB family protein [Cellulomons edaphi]
MSEPVGAGRAHLAAPPDDSTAPAQEAPADRATGIGGVVARVKALLAWWQESRPGRANARFMEAGGGVMTGGIAYAALFSVFAGLTIGYTVFMAVLGGNDELRQKVLDSLNDNLPGLIDTEGTGKGFDPETTFQLSGGLTVAGIVAVVVLVLSALSATAALRTGVRAMFAEQSKVNMLEGKLRQLGGLAGIAFAVLLSAILTTTVGAAAQWVLGALGWDDAGGVTLRVVGVVVAFAVDAAMFLLLVTLLAGEDPPRRDLLLGAVIAATGIGVVRFLGTSVVAGSVNKNPLFASATVIVTLLVWVNLIARIVLLAAAWVADPPQAEESEEAEGPEEPEPA